MWLRATVALAVLAAVGGCMADLAPEDDATTRDDSRGVVARVVDGDTLELRDGSRVRLVQIDAPEVASRECGQSQATAALRRLAAPGTRVTLRADARLDDRDRYGRLLRYVVLEGGRVANVMLVRQGHAAPYFYAGERGRYADQLLAAARDARGAGRGAWGACPRAQLDPSRAWSTS